MATRKGAIPSFKAQNKDRGFSVLSVASGKGGVGKTLTTVHLAVAAQQLGHRVVILDGDLGMANVDVVLGINPKATIHDLLDEKATIHDIVMRGPEGIRVIPSGSGFAKLTRLSPGERLRILESLIEIRDFDLLIIDTGAGISDTVMHLNSVADRVVVVTTPEPHAMTDAYAFMKVFAQQYDGDRLALLPNMVKSKEEGDLVFQRIATVAQKFLGVEPFFPGVIPQDPQIAKAVLQRKAGSESARHTVAGQAWIDVARQLLGMTRVHSFRTHADFWQQFVTPPDHTPRLRVFA